MCPLHRLETGGADEERGGAHIGTRCGHGRGPTAARQDAVNKKLSFTPADVDAPRAEEAGPEEEEEEEEVEAGMARLDLGSLVPYYLGSLVPYYLEGALGSMTPQDQDPAHRAHAPGSSDLLDASTRHHAQHGLLAYYVPDWRPHGGAQEQGHTREVAETALRPCARACRRGGKSDRLLAMLVLAVCLVAACGRTSEAVADVASGPKRRTRSASVEGASQ